MTQTHRLGGKAKRRRRNEAAQTSLSATHTLSHRRTHTLSKSEEEEELELQEHQTAAGASEVAWQSRVRVYSPPAAGWPTQSLWSISVRPMLDCLWSDPLWSITSRNPNPDVHWKLQLVSLTHRSRIVCRQILLSSAPQREKNKPDSIKCSYLDRGDELPVALGFLLSKVRPALSIVNSGNEESLSSGAQKSDEKYLRRVIG